MRAKELAKFLDAKLICSTKKDCSDIELTGVAPIDKAKAGEVAFLNNPAYAKFLATTKASIVILSKEESDCPACQIVHQNPYLAFARTAELFLKNRKRFSGISEKAHIAGNVDLGQDVTVYPFAYIGENAVVCDRTVIYPGAYIGDGAIIGADTVIHANAVIEDRCKVGDRVIVHGGAVIGADGFGFVPEEKGITKIPQTGIVVIEDDVEIGGNSTIDRATMEETRIGRGTKIDSSVHIGHNVKVGEHCFLCGMAGIAGSAKLGNRVVMAGHSGINNHVEVGDGVQVGGLTGLIKSTPEAGQYIGYPALPAAEWKRQQVRLKNLDKMYTKIVELEKKLERFEKK